MKIDATSAQLNEIEAALEARNLVLVGAIRDARAAGDQPGVDAAKAARAAVYEVLDSVSEAKRRLHTGGPRAVACLDWLGDGVALEPDDTAAEARGFAGFNRNPHLCVSVPNGASTITARTSDGRRITFAFLPYTDGAAPECCDVQFHDDGRTVSNGRRDLPAFDVVGFRPGGRDSFDSRTAPNGPPTLLTVLMETETTKARHAADLARAEEVQENA